MAEIKYLSKSGLETLADILATKSWVEGKNYTTASGHNHDGRYYTESEIDTKLAGKANADHDHRLLTSLVPQGTSIPAGADLNTIPYIKVGKYYCSTTANADDIINCPVSSAFMMEVYSPLSTTIDNESTSSYVYRIRKITHYSTGVQYIQYVASSKTAGQFTYGSWRVVPLAPYTLSATNSSSGTANNGGSAALGSATKGVYVKSDGTLASMTYTLEKSVPSTAVFTDTNTKVTNVGNHYTPEANAASALSADASSTTAATWGTTSLVTGVNLQRDAAGHVTGITLDSIKMPANPNTNVPLTDSYSGTSTTTALSQKGANSLYTTLNNKFGSYLPLEGGTLKGNLTMMPSNQHNADQFILFKYSTTDLDDYSWRIGYLGTGSSNANYFTIQNNGVGDTWTDVLYFGLTDQTAYFKNTPKVGTTKVSLEGHVHAASAITSGTLDTARIPNLTASKITSGVFSVDRIPDLAASKITSGTLADARIPALAASKITSGTFDAARIPNLAASKITSGTFADARIPNLAASKITSGTFDAARIPALNYLSLDGGTLKGPTFNSVLCTGDNLAVYTTQTSTVTGTIKIKLPFAFISSMMMFEIYIYDYSSTNGSKIYVSGYNYGTNSTYNNYGCTIIGKYNKKVRLSYDGSKCCILLGNVDSTWNYPQVILKSAFGGFTGKNNITQAGYEISVITDETNYTKTVECTNYLKATTIAWADITNKPTAFSPTGHTHAAADITSGTLSADRIPNLSAGKITSGVLGIDRTPKIAGHGTCSTAASTAAKVVTIADTTWTLKVGSIIGVKFSNSNSASGVTLNVNNTGAKSIYYNNEAYTSSSTSICGYKNRTTYYMYDGTYWVWLGMSYLDGNTDTKVRQYTTNDTNADYSILFRYSTAAPSSTYEANYSRYDSGITVNPSTNTITATNFKGNASSATISRYIQCPDTRSVSIVPSEVSATSSGVSFDFKSKAVTGLEAAYSGVMTFRPYSSSSDWSGGPIHQLAFDANGLHHRTASSDTWNAWKSISYTDHTHNYAPASHNHDDRYYTETEVNNLLSGKANSSHGTHVPGIKSASAVSTLGWSTNSNYVPDLSMLAYWNGAYTGTSSNLAYSANGTIIGTSNYTTYTVKKDGTGASGTWGINITGNAGTATKLATARTFNLSTGVTATAQSFDGSGNVVIPVTGIKESYLTWGGQNFSGTYGPIDAAMIPQLGANRFAFMPAESVTVEYSTNGGSSWSTYSVNNDAKINLFNGNGTSLYIGASSATKIDKSKYMLRITIATSAASVYTVLNKFIIYCSTSGSSGAYCTIDARLQSNYTAGTNTWVTFADKVSISGWSGYNVINTSGLTTYGNTAGSQYGQVRFTFGVTSHASSVTHPGLTINKIFGFGGVGWTTPSTMASTGQMYTYDASKNVTFPAKITATTFTGNLSGTASTATNLTNTPSLLISNNTIAVKAGEKTSSYITVPFATSATNADKVDGYHVNTGNKPFGTIPAIAADGVIEIGRYIDFHYDNTAGSDYSVRLQASGNNSNVITLPSGTGTLELTGHTHDGSTIINALSVGTSPAQRNDYIVAQYAGGGTTTTSYHRRTLANIFAALNKSDITTALGYTPPTTDTASGKTFKTLTSKSASGWTNNTTDDKIIPTMSFIAYWNGAYSGTNSNLTYSANGTIIGSSNYTSYTVKKDGTGATGTWGINISGNASTATNDPDGTSFKGNYLRKVTVANNVANDFNSFENMTLTGRGDPTSSCPALKNAPWTDKGPAGGYGVLTYLWSGYGTQMAWGYNSNRIYIRPKYYTNSASTWSSTWDSLALVSDLDNYAAKSHGNHVPATGTANDAIYLRNDNTWQTITPAKIGAAPAHNHPYIPLAGGTLEKNNSQIQRAGSSTSWYLGRSNAMIKINSYTGYNAIASMKTTNGDWSMGVYSGNKLYFSYVTDTDFNNNNNATTAQISLNPDGSITGNLSGNASTATKLATARTLTIGSTGKTFDGSGNVSWTLSEIGAAAASHGTHITDGAQTWSGNKTFNNQIILGSLNSSTSSSSNSQIVFGTSGAKLTSNGTGNIIMNPNSGTTGQIIFKPGTDPYISIAGTNVSLNGHTHSSILDSGNSTTTTFAYSKSGLDYADYTWLAAWNGYELRAVNKSQFAVASHNHKYLSYDDTTTFGTYSMQYKQLSGDYDGNTGWCHYLTFNHGDGATYYHYNVGFPFWGVPIYKRQTGSTAADKVTQWYKFITEENYDDFCAPAIHTHDDRYYTESEIDTKLAGKANSSHGTHVTGTTFTSGNSDNGEHNANNITSNGHWYYTSNGPATTLGATTTDGALYSQAYSSSWVAQIAQDYRNGNLFTRGKNNGTWTDWKAVSYVGHTHNYAASSHSHTYIKDKDNYSFTSSTLPTSFDQGISCGFVQSDNADFPSYGSVLTCRTYSGGGGTLQLYAPYSSTYGGTRLRARFGNYAVSNGNSWTAMKEIAWLEDIPTSLPANGGSSTYAARLGNSSAYYTKASLDTALAGKAATHDHPYLPTAGGTMTGNITFDSNRMIRWHASDSYSISCPTTSTAAYMLLKGFEGTTINKRLSIYKTATSAPNTSYHLYTDGSLYSASAVIGGSTTIANGSDITLKASSTNSTDPGDLVFANSSGTELGRIWLNGSVFSLRYGSSDAAKTILTDANIGTYALTSLPSHTHDDRYYTETEVNNLLANKANSSHGTHVPGIKSASAVSTLGWSTNSNYVPDLSMLAYWNGAYTGTSSNLAYSANGTIIGTSNYTTYTVKKDGTGASGTWGINITGNAETASSAGFSHYVTYTSRAGKGNGTAQFAQYTGATNNPTNDWYSHIIMNHANNAGYFTEIAACFHTDSVYFRRQVNGATQAWKEFSFVGHSHTSFDNNITVTGSVTASAGFFDNSDERLKDFYDDINVDFDKLKAIPKKYFSWKTDENKELHLGTSAQAIQAVYPEIVNDNEGTLTVDYSKLSVVALAAVDKLHDENVQLKKENEKLKDESEQLKSRLDTLEELLKSKGII